MAQEDFPKRPIRISPEQQALAEAIGKAITENLVRILRPELAAASAAEPAPEDKTRHRVKVFCGRDKGFWRAGRHWPKGLTNAEVSGAELAQLKAEPHLTVEASIEKA